jgi:hypothetical protein
LSGKKAIQYQKAVSDFHPERISNSDAATLILSLCRSLSKSARHFIFKRFNHDVYVMAGIFLFKVFPDLRRHVIFPKSQNLSLVVRERLQHFPHVVAAVQNVFGLARWERNGFDNGKFHFVSDAAVANGNVFHQLKVMLPFRAVVCFDHAAR